MSAPRKLSPEEEAAIMAWYAEYQAALEAIRKLGSIPQKAREYGVGKRTLHEIVKRDQEKVRRVLGCKRA